MDVMMPPCYLVIPRPAPFVAATAFLPGCPELNSPEEVAGEPGSAGIICDLFVFHLQ